LPAHAELSPPVERALKRYAPELQRAADELVFDIRPWIEKSEWQKVSSLFTQKGSSKANTDFFTPVNAIVDGNEEELPSLKDADVDLDAQLRYLNSQVGSGSDNKQANSIKAWENIASVLNRVMLTSNKIRSEDPSLGLPELVPIPKDVEAYPRSADDYAASMGRR